MRIVCLYMAGTWAHIDVGNIIWENWKTTVTFYQQTGFKQFKEHIMLLIGCFFNYIFNSLLTTGVSLMLSKR